MTLGFPSRGAYLCNGGAQRGVGTDFSSCPFLSAFPCHFFPRDFRAFATENAAFASTQSSMEGYSLEKKGTDSNERKRAGGTWADPHFTQTREHPVVCVSLADAEAFAKWLTTSDRAAGLLGADDRYRLPTDEEWSAACGLGKYPWGSAWPPPEGAGNFCGLESKTGPGVCKALDAIRREDQIKVEGAIF